MTEAVVRQYDAFEPLPSLRIRSKQTLGEKSNSGFGEPQHFVLNWFTLYPALSHPFRKPDTHQ